MKIRSRGSRGLALTILALGTLACAPSLWAMSYVQMKDADLIAQADGALEVTVSGAPQPVFDAEGVRIAPLYNSMRCGLL